ncbi:MAG: nucleotidyltransferase family protein, partial [Candidatus Nanohaloarchaeota archaeon QJJ-9]|nr:nucleotidyltransferase family protein [Candidatus Nanohaloarchaeota archaeon QJJ-9]
MQLDRQSFHELVQLLDGFNYCIFSGFAVKVFCDPGRECGDIDIMVPHQEIEKLAEKMGTEVRRRKEDGEGGANDYGFETSYSGLPVEVTSGFPRKRFKEGTLDKVIENR